MSIEPEFDEQNSKIGGLAFHYDNVSTGIKNLIRAGDPVHFDVSSLLQLSISIGPDMYYDSIRLPLPIDGRRGVCIISSGGSYLGGKDDPETTNTTFHIGCRAPIASLRDSLQRPDFMFPVTNVDKGVSLDTLHYVEPDKLPILMRESVAQEHRWIIEHTKPSTTMSKSEFTLYKNSKTSTRVPRIDFKNTLHEMFRAVLGLGHEKTSALFLCEEGETGHGGFMIFVHAIRMDLSNQTIFIDAAVLCIDSETINEIGEEIGIFQPHQGRFHTLNITKDEIMIWKHLLPTFAERCRTWAHEDDCEYRRSTFPLSLIPNEQFMCSCGRGHFPPSYVPARKWDRCRDYSTRVAIPICFTSPISRDDGMLQPIPTKESADDTYILDECFHCGTRPKNMDAAIMCYHCKLARYCSPECQKMDSGVHGQICHILKQNHKNSLDQERAVLDSKSRDDDFKMLHATYYGLMRRLADGGLTQSEREDIQKRATLMTQLMEEHRRNARELRIMQDTWEGMLKVSADMSKAAKKQVD